MPRAYSNDLRERVAAAVLSGSSCREAARLFDVSISSVVKWAQRLRATGTAAARPRGRKQPRSLAPQRDWLMNRLAAEPGISLRSLVEELRARGIETSYGSVWRIVSDQGGRPARRREARLRPARHGRVASRSESDAVRAAPSNSSKQMNRR